MNQTYFSPHLFKKQIPYNSKDTIGFRILPFHSRHVTDRRYSAKP